MTTENQLTLSTLTTQVSNIFDTVEQTSKSLTTEEYTTVWKFNKGVAEVTVREVGAVMTELLAYSTMDMKIKDKYPQLASRLMHNDAWKALNGIKSVNEAMLTILGKSAKGTVSGAVSVAKMFYNCNGLLIEPDVYGKSNYRCMQTVAQSTEKPYHKELCEWFREHPTCKASEMDEKVKELKNPVIDVESADIEETKQEETKQEETKQEETKQEETKQEEKAESKQETKQEEKAESKLSNAHYQLCQLRAHIDSLTKEQIKKALDDIIALG